MTSHYRRFVSAVVVAVAIAVGYRALAVGIVPKDLTTPGITPTVLANALVGAGVTISNVTFKGDVRAAGIFTGGSAAIGLEGGIVLSSGRISDVVGPNNSDSTTTDLGEPADATPRVQQNGCADPAHPGKFTLGLPGDSDLNVLSGFTTCDSTVLEFDFVPDKDHVFLQYVFASEEYNEFVNSQFNDVFAFFVNGANCATVDPAHRVPVSINTINGGGPFFGDPPVSHSDLYINNEIPRNTFNTQMDGMTKVLTCQAPVTPNAVNHMKLAIADASDPFYDSNVFLQAASLTTTPPLTIVKTTNGTDNDAAPGLFILVPPGASVPVTWSYKVTNNSITALTNVQVTDDKIGVITCPSTTLPAPPNPASTMQCSATGTAIPGQYTNVGTVTGISPLIGLVTDRNPDNYFGAQPRIAIVKKTNDTDNDAAPGPSVLVGSPVTWSYEVTNTGNVTLTGVTVTDSDPSLAVSCPTATLQAGSQMICLATAPAVAGQYENIGTVTATAPVGPAVTATNVDHYFGADPKMTIVKRTNGTDNNSAPGPLILVGDPVVWTYAVTNTGNVPLATLAVVDDQGVAVTCPSPSLAVGATVTCTGSGIARKGAYGNIGTATAKFGPVSVGGKIDTVTITASDPDHYFGADPNVAIVKQTNGTNNNTAPGPLVLVGDPVTWTYQVTNTGNVALPSVAVTDDRAGSICTVGPLAPGATTTCTKTAVAVRGQYENTGTATASVDTVTTAGQTRTVTVKATDIDHYFGADPRLAIVKQTNGSDNNAAPGPLVLVGDPVVWTYLVTNTGNVPIQNIAVTDDRIGAVCTIASLGAGATAPPCTKTGLAQKGQYENTGTAAASVDLTTDTGQVRTVPVKASDIDHYFGADPRVAIVKQTDGTNNDAAPGPSILVGDPVTWSYVVTNTGNVPLPSVAVTDDRAGAICTVGPLAVGESSLPCTKTGVAVRGQYENTGTAVTNVDTVTATGLTKSVAVTASDLDHYFGADPSVAIVKQTNGTNNNAAPGPLVLVGDPVTWSYVVTNTGNVPLPTVAVTDDRAGAICTVGPLAVGESSIPCTKTGVAVRGQYENTGTAAASVDTVTTAGQTRTVTVKATDIDHYFGADPRIAIVKQTNGSDNNAAPGPLVLVGDPVAWTYLVTNTGNVPLPNVAVSDDRLGAVCTIASLGVGATSSCTKTGIAQKGQYENTGTAAASVDLTTGTGQIRTVPVTASDIDHYFGADPRIAIVKQTNGTNNDAAPGPSVLVGEPVTWSYVVTNTGNVPLPSVAVTDDRAGSICTVGPLAVGASTSCTKTGVAVRGQYENTGTAIANVDTVTDAGLTKSAAVRASDIDHYFGADPRLTIVKRTFDTDNDVAPGPIVLVGTAARWSYTVTNTGNVPLANVVVTDNKEGPVCTIPALAAGQTAPACLKTGIVALGQYENVGTASTTFGPLSVGGLIASVAVSASNVDHYFGGRPGIAIVKKTIIQCPAQPEQQAENEVQVEKQNGQREVQLEQQPGNNVAPVKKMNGQLEQQPGNYAAPVKKQNGQPEVQLEQQPGNDAPPVKKMNDPCEVQFEQQAQNEMQVETQNGQREVQLQRQPGNGAAPVKKMNGQPAQQPGIDAALGPIVLSGSLVTWTYTVTNTGNLPLTAVTVIDDKVGAITCPATTLPPAPDPASTMVCSATGKTIVGQYENTGTASGSSALGPVVAHDVNHYFGLDSGKMFIVGDVEPHGVGDAVNFWGAQWWKNNQMSGLVTPGVASLKGYGLHVDLTGTNGCGGTWSTRPGNSPPPPDTIPAFVAIIVTDSVVKNGPVINGTIKEIVVVHQDGGYSPNPGHRGNGPVVTVLCRQP